MLKRLDADTYPLYSNWRAKLNSEYEPMAINEVIKNTVGVFNFINGDSTTKKII